VIWGALSMLGGFVGFIAALDPVVRLLNRRQR
jgi:hypothetical protein